MLKVFKYEIPIKDHCFLTLPRDAKVLSFQAGFSEAVIWALVDPDERETTTRYFCFAGTGHQIFESATNLEYIGTCQMIGLVWHLFEIIAWPDVP